MSPAKTGIIVSNTKLGALIASFLQADVFNVNTWKSQLEGAIGVVSCLGGFGSNEFMFKVDTF